MSLLLDALKKAELEKQKVRDAEAASASGAEKSEQEAASLPLEEVKSEEVIETLQVDSSDEEIEFVLDESGEKENGLQQEEGELDVDEPPLAPPIELEKSAATTTTVSDEALQLLVYKTNKKYRHRQRLVWGGLLSISTVLLVTAGIYYYVGMLDEVDALERKHKLAMRAVSAEPIKRHQQVKVIEFPEVEETQQKPSEQNQPQDSEGVLVEVSRPTVNKAVTENHYSIQKTKAIDPIAGLLRRAWLAYNKKDYALASDNYEKVLMQEPMNRDALLGMSAIAVKNAEFEKAREGYQILLKLNPRDQIAVAAISNLDKNTINTANESKIKSMLQQQPGAAHLNFALGNYYARENRWPEAQSEYFKAWQGDSENADYVYNLAVSLDQLGKSKEAINFYKKSLTLASNSNISFSTSDVEKRIKVISEK